MHARQRWLILALLMAMVLAACGSGSAASTVPSEGTTASSAPSEGAPSEGAPSQPTASDEPEPSEGGGGPQVGDNIFTGGKIKVDVSGDADFEAEIEANGIVTAGAVFLTGADGDVALQIAWSTTEAGGIAMTTTDLITGADFTACDLTVTKNDPTGLGGTVECKGADAVKNGITAIKVDIRIEFEAHP